MLELTGLTEKQSFICDLLWAMSSGELKIFRNLLNDNNKHEVENMIELMQLSFTDSVDSTDEATEVLDKIRKMK